MTWKGYVVAEKCPKCGLVLLASHTTEQCARWQKERKRAEKRRR